MIMIINVPCPAKARDVGVWRPLVDRLVADGLEKPYAESLFSRRGITFAPDIMARKMNVLLRVKLASVQPGPGPEPEVMDRYLNPMLIAGGYAYLREHRSTLLAAEKKYDVPRTVLVALLIVETKLGLQVGSDNGLKILASMALGGDFDRIEHLVDTDGIDPEIRDWLVRRTRQKGDWAYRELQALIEYARGNLQDPYTIPCSPYGAIGLCQFMPTSALHYGVDGNGDGRVDLFHSEDAIHSMANFLKRHGWKRNLDRAARLKVLYRYNHSESYAMTILAVADKLQGTADFFGG
ncbi:lytic murein transglycosylase [Pseudodesulfovibrio tunisiensis]|uniref:lytic murein transglycosylase n=1 Tax=Pseudodesulfovibrio tunisiensis TaxID=463192 RepID=UPI001FB47859|nr:lytic murein transglycosylase [Pseudodesulfovibrio tunisiensis]